MSERMEMSHYGAWHWVTSIMTFIITAVVVLYPIGQILGRIGLSPFWSILVAIPFVNLVAIWVLAFSEWPRGTEGGAP